MLNNSDVTGYTGNAFSLSNLINSKTVNKSLVGKIDYELPIGEKSMFNAGYKLDHNKMIIIILFNKKCWRCRL